MKETPVQQRIRLAAAQSNRHLWRNNVGALMDQYDRLVRYGLANESKRENNRTKSSDLIGITPLLITPAMVGYTIGVFTAIETKKSDWVFSTSDERAVAQLAFHDIVRGACGYAGFATSVEDYYRITGYAQNNT